MRGYEKLLGLKEQVGSLFYEKAIQPQIPTPEHRYRNALFHLLRSQTSCYRYGGSGSWTEYDREIGHGLEATLTHEF